MHGTCVWGGCRSAKHCVLFCRLARASDEGLFWHVIGSSIGVLQCAVADRIGLAARLLHGTCVGENTHWNGSAALAWDLCWEDAGARNMVFFSRQGNNAGDERYLVCVFVRGGCGYARFDVWCVVQAVLHTVRIFAAVHNHNWAVIGYKVFCNPRWNIAAQWLTMHIDIDEGLPLRGADRIVMDGRMLHELSANIDNLWDYWGLVKDNGGLPWFTLWSLRSFYIAMENHSF